jgi:hypothetical protein
MFANLRAQELGWPARQGVWDVLLAMLACLLLFAAVPAQAQDQSAVARGLAWLQSSVGADGSLRGLDVSVATPLQARSEAANTLRRLATMSGPLQDAIGAEPDDNTEYLARKLIDQVQTGKPVGDLVAALQSRQNQDGGFGGAPGFASNALDTAWALLALSGAPGNDAHVLASGTQYLLTVQNIHGGFGLDKDAPSAYVTALVVTVLQSGSPNQQSLNSTNLATAWLRSQQGADGGWGNAGDTSLVHLALLGAISDSALQTSARGYLLTQQGADGSWSGDPYVTAVALRALAAQPRPLPTKGSVTLQVIDAESGQPLAGATAQLQGSVIAPALTDATGRAGFKDIEANSYTAVVSAPGYASLSSSFMLAAGATVNAGIFKMSVVPSTSVVKGVVRAATTSLPVSDAVVAVTGSATASTITAADGSYVLSGLAPGTLNIMVSKNGFKPVAAAGTVAAGGVLAFSPQLPASTAAPGDPPEQPADPALPGTLSGKAVDATSGAPLASVTVRLAGTALAATSGADGSFALTGIAAGSYAVQLQKTGYTGRVLSAVLIAANSRTDLQSVPLAKEQTSVVVQGTVTNLRSGKPIADAHVAVTGAAVEARTDASGNYRIEGLATGAATLRFAASGYAGETVMAEFPAVGSYRLDLPMSLDDGGNPAFSQLDTDALSYGAYESVTFRMTIDNKSDQAINDAQVDLTIFNGSGQAINLQQAVVLDANGTAQFLIPIQAQGQTSLDSKWNTVAFAPGQYQVKARLYRDNPVTGAKIIISERTTGFTVESSRKLVRLAITPQPAFTIIDANLQLAMKVDAVNQSNVPMTTTFKYSFKAPDGTLVKEDTASMTLQPGDLMGSVVLPAFNYRVTASGIHPVELTVTDGETAQTLANGRVEAAPGVRVEAAQQVSPTTVTPDGNKRIHIQLQLKGVEQK